MEEAENQKTDAGNASLKKLMGGVAMGNARQARDGWRELLVLGPLALPVVLAQLHSTEWSTYKRKPHGEYLAVLLSLVSELDREAYQSEVTRLPKSSLHQRHRRTVDFFASAQNRNAYEFEVRGVKFAISSELDNPRRIKRLLSRWIQFPSSEDLVGLTAIDVIPFHKQCTFLGRYKARFSQILLTWPKRQPNLMLRSFGTLITELTFYHEIGHHACSHLEPCQVVEQEKEADEYARRLIRKNHPWIGRFALAVRSLIQPHTVYGILVRKTFGQN